MKLDITTFGGLVPKLGKHLLPESGATVAKNCRLGSGKMRPLVEMKKDHDLPYENGSMYRWKNGLWLHFEDANRHFCPGPVFGDDQRLYMSKASGGLSVWTLNGGEVKLGCPAPSDKPSVEVVGEPDSESSTDSRVYLYTCVDVLGQESAPSPASDVIDVQGQTVNISGMTTPDYSGYAAIVKKRVYRLAVGDEGADYLFVVEIDASETSYDDSLTDASLGEVMPSLGWKVPSDDLKGLCAIPNASFAAFHGQEVRLSEPNYPYAWPESYAYSVEYDIVGIACSGTYLFIFTEGPVYYMAVDDFSSAVPVRMDGSIPCVSESGIAEIPGGAVFPSRDGLYFVGSGYSRPVRITTSFYDFPDWSLLNPKSMYSIWHAGYLYVWHIGQDGKRGGLIFSFNASSSDGSDGIAYLVTSDLEVLSACEAVEGDKMFVNVGGICWEWEGGPTKNMKAQWQSRSFLIGNKVNFSSAIVEADIQDDSEEELDGYYAVEFSKFVEEYGGVFGGMAMLPTSERGFTLDLASYISMVSQRDYGKNIILTIYANGKIIFVKQITNREPFCLPAGFTGRTWYMRIRSNRDIRRIAIAESMSDLYE